MPKVTFSNAKGIVQEAGTGFQVNDAPITQVESETVGTTAQFVLTPIVVDDDGATVIDLAGKYFVLPSSAGNYYVWFDGGDEAATDPGVALGFDTDTGVRISDATGTGEQLSTLANVCRVITERLNSAASTQDSIDGGAGIDYSDLDNVLGETGDADVSDIFVASTDDSAVTIDAVQIGLVGASPVVTDLEGLGADEDQDWTVVTVNDSVGNGRNGNALITYGTTILEQATAGVSGTATLATAAAGTKKLIRMDDAPGAAGKVVLTLNDRAGSSTTIEFAAQNAHVYLMSTGLGWETLVDGI